MACVLQYYDDSGVAIGPNFDDDLLIVWGRELARVTHNSPTSVRGLHVKPHANPFRGLLWGCLISSVLWVVLVAAWAIAGDWLGNIL